MTDQTQVAEGTPSPRQIDSAELLRGERVVFIEHAGQIYRLIVTRNDKLILQK